jgi:CheY-like chemotaxis protein
VSKRKLLLADDSITIQKVVNLTFADEGIEVIAVGDGDSAMRKFDEFMTDLVMADVNMPGLNGYEICRIIKLTEETQNIPVILLVGSFEPFDEEEAKAAGADDFLTKPFQSIRQLVNKVTDLLNQRERIPAAPPSVTQGEPESEMPPVVSAVDTFAETLEIDKQEEAPRAFESREEPSSEFGDAGMDDEMIETSPAGGYVSGSIAEEEDQPSETTPDYAQTQPLNAEDLQSFSSVPGGYAAPEEAVADRETYSEPAEEIPERAAAATFDEEARKLGGNQTYEQSEKEEKPEVISETEPQIDYYLPVGEEETGGEFEKEMTDAETLAPEVSYSPEAPRSADFSQAETVEAAPETEPEVEESRETEETPSAIVDENEAAEFDKPEVDFGSAGEIFGDTEKYRETETAFETEAQTAETIDEPEAAPADETESAVNEKAQTEDQSPETPLYAPANLASMNFDEGDLLELPPLVEETGIRPQPAIQPLKSEPETVAAETVSEPETEKTETETVGEIESMHSFPPELIEAIAQKVAEKISAKTMNDVLPQITELVMKKLAEEKMKE